MITIYLDAVQTANLKLAINAFRKQTCVTIYVAMGLLTQVRNVITLCLAAMLTAKQKPATDAKKTQMFAY